MLDRIFVGDTVRALRPDFAVPLMNRVVDAYNAVSVRYSLPIGGEDLDAGPARLVRAEGGEPFDTVENGEPVVEHAEPYPLDRLTAAGAEPAALLRAIIPEVAIATRLIEP